MSKINKVNKTVSEKLLYYAIALWLDSIEENYGKENVYRLYEDKLKGKYEKP